MADAGGGGAGGRRTAAAGPGGGGAGGRRRRHRRRRADCGEGRTADEIDARFSRAARSTTLPSRSRACTRGTCGSTRLEASLPHAALADDLEIEAAPEQVAVENWRTAATSPNAPCDLLAAGVPPRPARHKDPKDHGRRNRSALAAAAFAAIAAAFGRRARRPRRSSRRGASDRLIANLDEKITNLPRRRTSRTASACEPGTYPPPVQTPASV